MQTIFIESDIKVHCINAESFPDGIQNAHENLHAIIPFSTERRYFGISRPENGEIVYKAAAEVLENDVEEEFNCDSFIIKKGQYRCMTLLNYKMNIDSINNIFEKLLSYSDIDPNGCCIEWYYSDEDVKCMVRLKDYNSK